ncbi:MAG: hypothetical protein GXO78_09260 [Calditrichaeota bacterium]|nr:hypothetical protein [Calditrichota bacterium]
MNITLNDFEHLIDPIVVERGLDYFQNGQVIECIPLPNGEYRAIVRGLADYTVLLKLKNGEILDYRCDCPYDWGPFCKHIVAVLYYLRAGKSIKGPKESTIELGEDAPPVSRQFIELLEKVSYADLKAFVKAFGKDDLSFQNRFLLTFAHLLDESPETFYRQYIATLIPDVTDEQGQMDWYEMKLWERDMDVVISFGMRHYQAGNFQHAVAIFMAVVDTLVQRIRFEYDDHGTVSEFIQFSCNLLQKMASIGLPESLRKTLFDFCMEAFEQPAYADWDLQANLLEIAQHLVKEEHEANQVLACLDAIMEGYQQERVQVLKYELLKRFKSETDVQKFVREYISNPRIRCREIEAALKNRDFEQATALAREGIRSAESNPLADVSEWYHWLLKIAQLQSDKARIIEYAAFLFIHALQNREDYFRILKQTVEKEAWADFLESLIERIQSSAGWRAKELLQKIYIAEQIWDRLFLLVKENASLEFIEMNEHYLKEDYSRELVQLYSQCLISFLEKNTGRSHYRTACRFLRKMKKLGGSKQVEELVAYFKTTYPRRRALMEELKRI